MALVPDLSGNFPPSLPSGMDMPLTYNLEDIYARGSAVTPNDDTVLNTRALYIGGGGNVVVRTAANPNEIVTFTAVPTGAILPVEAVRVMAATTALNIIALN